MSHDEREIKRLLSEAKPAEAPEALERTAAAARSAAAASRHTRAPRRLGRLAIASVGVAAVIGFSLTPPGRAVTGEVGQLVGIGEPATIDHGEQGEPLEPTTDEIVIATGATADGERYEMVAFEAEHSQGVLEDRQKLNDELREQVLEMREQTGEDIPLSLFPELPRNLGACISLDWIDRPNPRGGATCSDGPQRDPLSMTGTSYDAKGLYGPAARLLILGMTGPEVARVEVTYERAGGETVQATTALGRLTGDLAEQAGATQQFGMLVAFVPAEDVNAGGPFADAAETVHVVAYADGGQEIKREDFEARVSGIAGDREPESGFLLPFEGADHTRTDTTKFEAMRAALEAGEIEQGQNPCTYPIDLRRKIGLSNAECDGQLGRDLARQYR